MWCASIFKASGKTVCCPVLSPSCQNSETLFSLDRKQDSTAWTLAGFVWLKYCLVFCEVSAGLSACCLRWLFSGDLSGMEEAALLLFRIMWNQ
ncbi:hypothetical protein BaRGS_00029489 [Batillaria attramentaria]|uniref:Uncharacterized protein n=1 Tax=Batillaria attramentaria TaxID=370345 RepID=A0ABD0JVZ3_9CAEN